VLAPVPDYTLALVADYMLATVLYSSSAVPVPDHTLEPVPDYALTPVPYSASAGTGAKLYIGTVAPRCHCIFLALWCHKWFPPLLTQTASLSLSLTLNSLNQRSTGSRVSEWTPAGVLTNFDNGSGAGVDFLRKGRSGAGVIL